MKKDNSKNIFIVFGTRPEAIKMAPVLKQLQSDCRHFRTTVCVTAQHREMLDQALELYDIKPDYNLNIMERGQSLFEVTTKCLLKIKEVLEKEKTDMLLVQGDTTTAFAASLAAFYFKIPVAHIEAGLRTNDKYQPFPEEINRRLISHIADIHFAPTKKAKQNLLAEGISESRIFVTGNTVIDALQIALKNLKADNTRLKRLDGRFSYVNPESRLILVTAHRRESFGKDIEDICMAIKEIADNNAGVEVVYPVHLNPNVREPVFRILASESLNNPAMSEKRRIHLIEPLDYESFIYLMDRSYLILTDSGGIQEEAPSLGKPVLVMRKTSERTEAVNAGIAKLVGMEKSVIIREVERLLHDREEYKKMALHVNLFGDGTSGEKILEVLTEYFHL
ncbi:UDP-N-acetylglucosamine 2-epimerase (non-hydrolyzing) [bacterium]|nr:UDP-N-acetylglucosamine 2-epimerase (non-hydrolyzing) [bacterium]